MTNIKEGLRLIIPAPKNVKDLIPYLTCERNIFFGEHPSKACPYSKLGNLHQCTTFNNMIATLDYFLMNPQELNRFPEEERRQLESLLLYKPCVPPLVRDSYEFSRNSGEPITLEELVRTPDDLKFMGENQVEITLKQMK